MGSQYAKLIFIFAIICFYFNSTSGRSLDAVQNTDLDDIFVADTPLQKLPTSSVITCGIQCLGVPTCLTFAIHKSQKECMIFQENFLTAADVKASSSEVGWRFYNRKQAASCPATYTYNTVLDTCFKLYPSGLINSFALDVCLADGGNFARIDSQAKQDEVKNYLGLLAATSVRIQGRRVENTNNWNFEDSTSMSFFSWNTPGGQPEHRAGEVVIMMRDIAGYKWHDGFLFDTISFLCEVVVPLSS